MEYGKQIGMHHRHQDPPGSRRRRMGDIGPKPMYAPDAKSFIMVPEPCNAVSSLSFYRSMLTFCEMKDTWTFDEDIRKTLAQVYGILAWGAAFMHIDSENSTLGQQLDLLSISLITLLGYQGSIQAFRASLSTSSSSVYTLQEEEDPVYKSGVEAVREYARIILDGDVMNWSQQFQELQQSIPE